MERQMVTSYNDIRPDHIARYQFAKQWISQNLPQAKHVVDLGAGVGYGGKILAQGDVKVTSIEKCEAAADVYRKHFACEDVTYMCQDICDVDWSKLPPVDAVVSFEFVEHIPETLLKSIIALIAGKTNHIIFSTPNELVRPHKMPPVNKFHFKHYTPAEMEGIMGEHGYSIKAWYNQKSGAMPEITPGTNGKFIIGIATS